MIVIQGILSSSYLSSITRMGIILVKAASRKFDCSMDIDFQNGNRKAEFIGDEIFKPSIAEEVECIFAKKEKC